MNKVKKKYYENLDLHNVTDTERVWKTVKPVFGSKIKTCNTISLIKKTTVIISQKVLAKTFCEFYVNIVSNLGIDVYIVVKLLHLIKFFEINHQKVQTSP